MSKLLTHGTVIRSRKIFVHLKCTILWYPSVFHFNLLNSSNQRQLSLLLLYEHLISHCSDVRISFWTVQSIVFSIFLFCNACAKLSCKIKLEIFSEIYIPYMYEGCLKSSWTIAFLLF